MAEFADEEELAEVIAAIPSDDAWLAANTPDLQSPEADTAKAAGGRVGWLQRLRRNSQSRRIAKQRFRRNVQLVLFGSAVAVIAGLLAWVATRPPAIRGETRRRQATQCLGRRRACRRRTAACPQFACRRIGPAARAERPLVVRRNALVDAVPARGDCRKSAFRHRSGRRAGRSPSRVSRSQYGRGAEVALGSGPAVAAGTCRQANCNCWTNSRHSPTATATMTRKRPGPSTMPCSSSSPAIATAQWPAADLHTVALLQHDIAELDHDKLRAQEAKKSYDKALDAYSAAEENAGIHAAALPRRFGCLVRGNAGRRQGSQATIGRGPGRTRSAAACSTSARWSPAGTLPQLRPPIQRIRRPSFHLCQEASGGPPLR